MDLITPAAAKGKRLDHFLQESLPDFSRSRLTDWIKSGLVLVNGQPTRASLLLKGGEAIIVTPAALPALKAEPEDIPLEILYEDAAVIAVNKPSGMVVHAGAGNHTGTLVNALVHRFKQLSELGGDQRPGIVHRLDKETSGVILVARTDDAHRKLAAQFSTRTLEKLYLTLVHGSVRGDTGKIETPITRDPVRRTRMTTKIASGRQALTHYNVLDRFEKFTYLKIRIGTGRTHQIRVHMASLGHPVVGDRLYGAPQQPAEGPLGSRFFLHAWRITFDSPAGAKDLTVESPLPAPLAAIIGARKL